MFVGSWRKKWQQFLKIVRIFPLNKHLDDFFLNIIVIQKEWKKESCNFTKKVTPSKESNFFVQHSYKKQKISQIFLATSSSKFVTFPFNFFILFSGHRPSHNIQRIIELLVVYIQFRFYAHWVNSNFMKT